MAVLKLPSVVVEERVGSGGRVRLARGVAKKRVIPLGCVPAGLCAAEQGERAISRVVFACGVAKKGEGSVGCVAFGCGVA